MKSIRSENESEMEVVLVAFGGAPLNVSTSTARALNVRPNLILDLRSGCNLGNSKHDEKAWSSWTVTQPSLVVLSPMRRSVACGDQVVQKMAAKGSEHQTTCMNFVKEQIKKT